MKQATRKYQYAPPSAVADRAFDRLLGQQVSRRKFFEIFWEQKPLHARTKQEFSDLFSLKALDAILQLSMHKSDAVRLVKSEGSKATNFLPNGYSEDDTVHTVHAALSLGATVVVNSLHMKSPELAKYADLLEATLEHHVGINAYYTPSEQQGLLPHVDEHAVFIVQIDGSKTWAVYEESGDPDEFRERVTSANGIGDPTTSFTLVPGDVLYLPVGYPHVGTTRADASLHLTVGIYPYSWGDLAMELLQLRRNSERIFRTAVPSGYLCSDPSQIPQEIQAFGTSDEIASALNKLRRRFASSKKKRYIEGGLKAASDAQRISLSSEVSQRPNCRPTTFVENGDAVLVFSGNTVTCPIELREALEFVVRNNTFVVSRLPSGLTDETKLMLASRLMVEGLLFAN